MNIVEKTPIIVYFWHLHLTVPEHFNQSMMLSSSIRLDVDTLKASFNILCQYHDMLRAVWNGENLNIRAATDRNLFHMEEHDLRNSSQTEVDMLPLCESLQSSINLAQGPLMRVAVFHLQEGDVVLVVVHHLVVDGVSWRILIEDLNKIYSILMQGRFSVRLPKRKCSFAEYARALNVYAQSEELLREEGYWQKVADTINAHALQCFLQTHHRGMVTFQLDATHTRWLMAEGNRKYGVGINALLLTALSNAWKEVMGQSVLSLFLEGHGREQFGGQRLPLERLVGWFTTIFPIVLVCEKSDLQTQAVAIQTMLEAIPNKGLGYGVLSHLAGKEHLVCKPQMTFNYLGSFDEDFTASIFSFNHTLPQGTPVSLENQVDTALSINCAVVDGILMGALTYDTGMLDACKAEALSNAVVTQLKMNFNYAE